MIVNRIRRTVYLLPHRGAVLRLTGSDKWRFKRQLAEVDGCLVWSGSFDSNGYGVFYLPKYKLSVAAHRAAWVFAGKTITDDKPFVLNDCPQRNSVCCRLEHLKAGSVGENVRDTRGKVWPKQPPKPTSYRRRRPSPSAVDNGVKLLGRVRRPTDAEVFGRKPSSRKRRTYAEICEDNRLARMARERQRAVDKAVRKREMEAKDERRRQRQERQAEVGA